MADVYSFRDDAFKHCEVEVDGATFRVRYNLATLTNLGKAVMADVKAMQGKIEDPEADMTGELASLDLHVRALLDALLGEGAADGLIGAETVDMDTATAAMRLMGQVTSSDAYKALKG